MSKKTVADEAAEGTDDDDRYDPDIDEEPADDEERKIRALRTATRRLWQSQLAAMTERLLEGDGLGNADVAEVVRALAWAVTAGSERDEEHKKASARILGRLRSLAVRELREEQDRLAHVPEEERYLSMPNKEIGSLLIAPESVHRAHAMTDEVRAIVRSLVDHRYDGLSARQRHRFYAHAFASIVLGPLVTEGAPRLRALLPANQRVESWRAYDAVTSVLDNTEPEEELDETARRILGAILRALGADSVKVKRAIQDAYKRR